MSDDAVVNVPVEQSAVVPPAQREAPVVAHDDGSTSPINPLDPSPAQESKPEPKVEEQPPAEPPKNKGAEARINRLLRERAEQKARADLYERQIKELQQKSEPAKDPSAPKMEEFTDIKEYEAAVRKHERETLLKSVQQQQQEQQTHQAQAQLEGSWAEKINRGETKFDDFYETVGDLKPDTPWKAAIMRSDNGDDIAYHLGKNLTEARRIAALDPISQLLEIGRLSTKLETAPPQAKKKSEAPPPISPLKGGANVNTTPSESDDMATWMKKRNRQVHG